MSTVDKSTFFYEQKAQNGPHVKISKKKTKTHVGCEITKKILKTNTGRYDLVTRVYLQLFFRMVCTWMALFTVEHSNQNYVYMHSKNTTGIV